MKKAELKNFAKPDEVREFPKGKVDVLKVSGATVGRAVLQPGWRWSTSVQPIQNEELRSGAFSISHIGSAKGPYG